MTPVVTHAKATHHGGPVCGADDGPATRVSEDPLQITCPDCPDLVWIEELPNDATAGDPRIIEVLREATRGHMRKVDGLIVDGTTAAAILTVYEVMKPPTRAKFLALDLDKMTTVAWRLLRPHL
ncbi:hypothetical protein [Couchioplanes caeruleus]|uniref:Uncharacterized protein n=2 Tax=Couchioplanes caeruleus TaxID=56438 RepID=A0A1K0G7B0_9ACTN|nr:hypothetical protein [Couchioplanes caeruleus]OJF13138.1 hypothetical protein BG844_16835 [Couchioplanes caeruleus subsp. caeruleus]ROP28112.1 hypothetical protein EDD30_0821 [Couchioplanes caeruleus]